MLIVQYSTQKFKVCSLKPDSCNSSPDSYRDRVIHYKMRNIFLIFFFFLITTRLFGQSDQWYFSFNLGGSWPVGEFANKTSTDLKSGYAQKGFSLSLNADYAFNSKFAVKGMAFLNNNPVNRLGVYNQLVDRLKQYFPLTNEDLPYLSMSVNPWVWNGILIGPVYTINFTKLFWDFQVLGGLNITYLPQQKLLYENPANNWLYLHHNLNRINTSYGLLAGTAFRFPVSDKIYLRLGIDYYNSRASVKYEEIKLTKEGSVIQTDQLTKGTAIVPIENISGTLGFVYYLD